MSDDTQNNNIRLRNHSREEQIHVEDDVSMVRVDYSYNDPSVVDLVQSPEIPSKHIEAV